MGDTSVTSVSRYGGGFRRIGDGMTDKKENFSPRNFRRNFFSLFFRHSVTKKIIYSKINNLGVTDYIK